PLPEGPARTPLRPARTPLDLSDCDGDHEMGILNLRELTVPSSVAARAAARRSSLVPLSTSWRGGQGVRLTRRARRAYARRESAPSRTLSPTPDRRHHRTFGPVQQWEGACPLRPGCPSGSTMCSARRSRPSSWTGLTQWTLRTEPICVN